MGKSILITTLAIFFTFAAMAQTSSQNSDFWDNVRFGGGIGLGFGTNIFNAAVSPSAVYQVSQEFSTGLNLNLNYSKFGDARLLAYGPSFVNFYNPFPFLQVSGEFEQWWVNQNQSFNGGTFNDNFSFSALFLGLGYTQRNITFGLRYDVLHDPNRSIYADALIPFVRIYF